MKDIGSGHGGKTLAQVASNWVMCKGAIPIVGEFLCLCSSCFLLFVAVFPAQVAINWVMCKGAIPIVGELFWCLWSSSFLLLCQVVCKGAILIVGEVF